MNDDVDNYANTNEVATYSTICSTCNACNLCMSCNSCNVSSNTCSSCNTCQSGNSNCNSCNTGCNSCNTCQTVCESQQTANSSSLANFSVVVGDYISEKFKKTTYQEWEDYVINAGSQAGIVLSKLPDVNDTFKYISAANINALIDKVVAVSGTSIKSTSRVTNTLITAEFFNDLYTDLKDLTFSSSACISCDVGCQDCDSCQVCINCNSCDSCTTCNNCNSCNSCDSCMTCQRCQSSCNICNTMANIV